jgi:hypothetical protein
VGLGAWLGLDIFGASAGFMIHRECHFASPIRQLSHGAGVETSIERCGAHIRESA